MSGKDNKRVHLIWRGSYRALALCGTLALLLAYPAVKAYTAVGVQSVPTVSITEYSFEDGILNVESNVLSDGGASVSERGVVWSEAEQPTLEDDATNDGMGTGTFSSTVEELEEGGTYYIRAYAVNTDGTAYSGQLIVTMGLPTISTVAVHGITGSTAWSGGNITSNGGANIDNYGVCWSSSSEEPTIEMDNTTSDGEGSGEFSSKMTELIAGTTYYVRAYAETDSSVVYGETYSFVPNDDVSAYMIWHSKRTGKVVYWKLNNEGVQIDNDQGSGWDYIAEDVNLNSNWQLAGTTKIGGNDTLIWHNQDSGKIVFWKLTEEKKLESSEQGEGWDFVAATITLASVWRLVDVREIDGDTVLFWYSEKNGKAAWWKLGDDCYIKNETKGEGWDYASDEDNFLGSQWNLAGVIDAD